VIRLLFQFLRIADPALRSFVLPGSRDLKNKQVINLKIKKIIIEIYRTVADFFLNNSGSKLKWRDKKGDLKNDKRESREIKERGKAGKSRL